MNKEQIIEKIINLATHIADEDDLRKRLMSDEKLTIKLGADPSRPDLHLGHTVPLRVLKTLQELGHEVVFIIGDFTAMIGDPSGKSKTRPSLSYEETRESGKSYYEQVTKILDPAKTNVVYNSEWLNKLSFHDIINLTGKYTLARIMERDDFTNRYANHESIGMHELLYPLIQGYDSVAIKSDIEVGGTDQLFNLLVGRELQKDYKVKQQNVICFPLLPGLDGKEKMSKSLDNYIGISELPEKMFEKSMKIPDDLLFDYFKYTTDLNLDEVKNVMEENIFEAHKVYGRELVKMYHGQDFVKEAEERYSTVAKGGVPEDIDVIELDKNDYENEIVIIDLVYVSTLASSKSEARRLITQNGIKLNNEKVSDITHMISVDSIQEDGIIIQRGKNKFAKVIIK